MSAKLFKTVFPVLVFVSHNIFAQAPAAKLTALPLESVTIQDAFWSPKLKVWDTKTVYDVLDKLEGKYVPDRKDIADELRKTGRTRNAFYNFDLVAQGRKDLNAHDGPPWYDGLVYETFRGAADLMIEYPDPNLEKKIDAYIVRIAAAQNADPDGYINTYTTLMRSHQRFGTNGGNENWQHDIYNAGMLAEAAVHYYNATGKTQLLDVATKMANYMYSVMGPEPKQNIVPGHGGPEETMLKLFQFFQTHPEVKSKMKTPVDEKQYYDLAKFWIDTRGNHGKPDGTYSRTNWGPYNQDSIPVVDQKTIEGHAVRATLLATGVTAMAMENNDAGYTQTANNYWNNMIGQRLFITGGQGAIPDGEKFGPDYFLPENAYLETCASIGAGFFSQQMNELKADGKYIDELERVLYNNLLSSISLNGDQYHYENPLSTTAHPRWVWHDCPCCPPMFLKMVGALPRYIYGLSKDAVFVNLFISSNAKFQLKNNDVSIQQKTEYPWKGKVELSVNSSSPLEFPLYIRIPGWAVGKENPFDLYSSAVKTRPVLKVNGKAINIAIENGYAAIKRKWNKGDKVELILPVEPRIVYPSSDIRTISGKAVISAGPIVYAFESVDNPGLSNYMFSKTADLKMDFRSGFLNGVNTISGEAKDTDAKTVKFTAIPFYAIGNRGTHAYQVWIPVK